MSNTREQMRARLIAAGHLTNDKPVTLGLLAARATKLAVATYDNTVAAYKDTVDGITVGFMHEWTKVE